jgi:hypothetical protein
VPNQTSPAMLNRSPATLPNQISAAMLQQASAARQVQTGVAIVHPEARTRGRPVSDFDNEDGAGCSFWVDNREPK